MTHDKKAYYFFAIWLKINLGLVFLMIIIGGLTRLTDSGLSITEWELFKGIFPPLNESEWKLYFNQYKEIPQYKLMNPNMTLNEFKVIFYWEYIHRILGRLIGIFFFIPLIYFHFFKKIKEINFFPYYIIFLLILIQGFIGWFMVQSGLVNDVTVSHYRLSVHLSFAILIISIIFWQILNINNNSSKSFFNFNNKKLPYFILIFLIFFQIVLGAFVSGLDAGKVYQTWPLMGYNYFPNDVDINKINDFFDFNNHSLVQFYHRNVAYIITIYIFVLSYFIFKNKSVHLYKPFFLVFLFLSIQIVIGIFTLLSGLKIIFASVHQISGVILVLTSINLYFSTIK